MACAVLPMSDVAADVSVDVRKTFVHVEDLSPPDLHRAQTCPQQMASWARGISAASLTRTETPLEEELAAPMLTRLETSEDFGMPCASYPTSSFQPVPEEVAPVATPASLAVPPQMAVLAAQVAPTLATQMVLGAYQQNVPMAPQGYAMPMYVAPVPRADVMPVQPHGLPLQLQNLQHLQQLTQHLQSQQWGDNAWEEPRTRGTRRSRRNRRTEPVAPEQGVKVFVGGLGPSSNSQTLREYFSEFGIVLDAAVLADPDTKRSRGFGFVEFAGEIPAGVVDRDHIIEQRRCGVRKYSYNPGNGQRM